MSLLPHPLLHSQEIQENFEVVENLIEEGEVGSLLSRVVALEKRVKELEEKVHLWE